MFFNDAKTSSGWRAWDLRHVIAGIALMALLILAWFFGFGPGKKGCCGTPSTMPTASAPAAAVPAAAPSAAAAPSVVAQSYNALWDGNIVTLRGKVKDQGMRDRMLLAARTALGETNVKNELVVTDKLEIGAWSQDIAPMVEFFKGKGEGGVSVEGAKLTLTGTVQTKAERDSRGEWAKAYFGAAVEVDNQIRVLEPVAKADPGCADAIKANIEFASAKADITPKGKAVLDKIAACLTSTTIEVSGHTDSRGVPERNQALSQARAEAVVAYLVGKGMDKTKLSAKGFGATRPIADNATPAGLQKNRRIEFTAK